MSGGVTVIGLIPGSFTIEDIKVTIPYQTAVQIPAHLAQRSKNLGEAIHHQRVMQLGNALPLPAVPNQAPPLAPILRGRGIAPHNLVPTKAAPVVADASWQREREGLLRELAAARGHESQLQGINEGLQASIAEMSGQLVQIQQTLSGLNVVVPDPAPGGTRQDAEKRSSDLNDFVPHFIPPTVGDVAEVRISIPETTSESDLSGARGALRSLRSKASP